MKPSHFTPKLLHCIAPDGEHVTERRLDPFPDTESAWEWSAGLGSKWFFYPIHVVTSLKGIIADVPHGMPEEWIGRRLDTLKDAIASDPDHACEFANGQSPFCIYPHPIETP